MDKNKRQGERMERVSMVMSTLDQAVLKLCEIMDEKLPEKPLTLSLSADLYRDYVDSKEWAAQLKRKQDYQQMIRFQIAQLCAELDMLDEFIFINERIKLFEE